MSISFKSTYARTLDYKDSMVEMKFSQLLRRLKARGYRYSITITELGVSTELKDPEGNPVTLETAVNTVAALDEREKVGKRIRTAVARLSAQANLERIRSKLNNPEWVPPGLEAVELMTAEQIQAAPEVKAAMDNKVVWGNFLGSREQRA